MTEGNAHDDKQETKKNRKKKTNKGKQATKPKVAEDVKPDEIQMKSEKGKKRKLVENVSEGKKAPETLDGDGKNEKTEISVNEKKKKMTKKPRGDGSAGDISNMEDTSEKREVAKTSEEDQQTENEKPPPKRKGKNKQKKKKKNQAPASNQVNVNAQRACIRYLQLWDTDRAKWHFQKVRQVWLLQNMYDKEKVPKSEFHILLRYLENMKGKSREVTIKYAEDLIKKLEDKVQNLKDQETSSDGGKKEEMDEEATKIKVQWRRATDILQTLT